MLTTDVLSTVTTPVFRAKPAVSKTAEVAEPASVANDKPSTTAEPQPPAPAQQEVQQAAQQIQKYLAQSGRTLEFHVDDASGVPVVIVRDAHSGDVIRQIPNEEVLHVAQMLKENSQTQHALVNLTV